jgi:hypothetical protein
MAAPKGLLDESRRPCLDAKADRAQYAQDHAAEHDGAIDLESRNGISVAASASIPLHRKSLKSAAPVSVCCYRLRQTNRPDIA